MGPERWGENPVVKRASGTPDREADQGPSRKLLFVLALCAGAAVANLYYAQPLLALIAHTFNAPATVGLVAVTTQVGYTLGILFILPLGDLVDRRRLTVILVGVLALSTIACALAPSLGTLAIASLFVGVGAMIAQILIPFAADLAAPAQRARAVGVVFSGILGGILLARTISGVIAEALGWRPMFVIASVAAMALGVILSMSLPKVEPKTSQRYLTLLGSMFGLLVRHPSLCRACAIQACLFAIFSAFWSVLALLLAKPPFELGPTAAGAFGIVGLAGVGAANISGRLIDRYGRRLGLFIGLTCCVVAYGILLANLSLITLVAGVLLLDFGMSVANVANQSMILGLDTQATSRINTIYVTSIFLGGAMGSAVASAAWAHSGWPAVCAFGFAVALLAFGIHVYEWQINRRSPATAK